MAKEKKSVKISPQWLDEDPDDKTSLSKHGSDIYGEMNDVHKFSAQKEEVPPPSKPSQKESLAQFCGRLGMRYIGDTAQLDLHGMRLSTALTVVQTCINTVLDDGRIKKLRIITGKGNHTQGAGVLAKEIHPFVRTTFAKSLADIDASPAELLISGHPAKGFFDLKLI